MIFITERWAPRFIIRINCILDMIGYSPRSFLEIGCGIGDFLVILQKLGWKGIALDTSKEAVKKAKKKVSSPIDVFHGDKLNGDYKFDCVFALEVLEHLSDDLSALIQWKSYLLPDSLLIISVPAHKKSWTRHDDLTGHYRRYEKDELLHLLKEAGYNPVRLISYGFPIINLTNVIKGLIPRRDIDIHSSKDSRSLKSGLIRWKLKNNISLYLLKIIVKLSYPFQKRFWDKDWGDGYIVIAKPNFSHMDFIR